MRILVAKAAVRRVLRLCHWVLGVGAVLMLGYSGLLWADGWYFQKAERRHFEQLLSERTPTAALGRTVLPALPTGMQCTSGPLPSASQISNAAVF